MKKKWLFGIGALILIIGAIAADIYVGDDYISCKPSKEVAYLRQIGIHLFEYANDRNGVYPDSIRAILPEIKEENLRNFIHDPRFTYHPPMLPLAELKKDYVVLSYDFPGNGKVTHTAGHSTQYVKNKSEPGH